LVGNGHHGVKRGASQPVIDRRCRQHYALLKVGSSFGNHYGGGGIEQHNVPVGAWFAVEQFAKGMGIILGVATL
jgi:hypothetical protein